MTDDDPDDDDSTDLEANSYAVPRDDAPAVVTPIDVRGEVVGRRWRASPRAVVRLDLPLGAVDLDLDAETARRLQAAIDDALADARAALPPEARSDAAGDDGALADGAGMDGAREADDRPTTDDVLDDHLPHLGENLRTARRRGVDADVLAGALAAAAARVRAGDYDPHRPEAVDAGGTDE